MGRTKNVRLLYVRLIAAAPDDYEATSLKPLPVFASGNYRVLFKKIYIYILSSLKKIQ